MSNPIVSLYASAARPENWKKLYDSVKYNKCEFEIVFVGPNAPKDPLPSEFKFIQSYTKPVQCAEIAARNTKGVFLLHCVDDLEFKDKNALDVMIAEYDRISGEAILSPKLMRDGNPFPEDNYKLFPMSENCPPIPISLFMKRSVFESLGGYDVNFIASFADTDIAFRALSQRKARIEFLDLFVEEDKEDALGTTLFEDYSDNDLILLKELWFDKEHFTGNRSKNVFAFVEKDITRVSQGRRGRWGPAGQISEKVGIRSISLTLRKTLKKIKKIGSR